jgi:hypothetical protein
MIMANLKGGLCNQMFQIAAGYSLAKRNNDIFYINYQAPHNKGQGFHPCKYMHTMYLDIPTTIEKCTEIYREPFCHYSPIPYKNNMIIDGYFQSSKYFEDYENNIKELFSFKSIYIEPIVQKCNTALSTILNPKVAIHIRLGDYKYYPNIHGTTMAYYHRAIKDMQEYYLGRVDFIICSDEKEYIRNEFTEITPIISNSVDELEDLYIITQCDAVIMSNSSFSWWGAYLGNNKQRVICPDVWFKSAGAQDYQDIYLKKWIRMS